MGRGLAERDRGNLAPCLDSRDMIDPSHRTYVRVVPTEVWAMRCEACSHNNRSGAKFCDECGQALLSTRSSTTMIATDVSPDSHLTASEDSTIHRIPYTSLWMFIVGV